MFCRRLLLAGVVCSAAAGLVAHAQTGAPSAAVAQASASDSLKETQWNLIELDGNPVASSASPPYIYLHDDHDKLTGSGGCNRLFGSFDLDGNSLQFHSVALTLMACAGDAGAHEAQLLEALKLVTGYRISGDELELRVDDRVL